MCRDLIGVNSEFNEHHDFIHDGFASFTMACDSIVELAEIYLVTVAVHVVKGLP